jgi:hypothetical protein
LLFLIWEQMDGQRKLINIGFLATQVKDTDLGVGDTTTKAGFGIRLVLAVTVTTICSLFPPKKLDSVRLCIPQILMSQTSYRAGRRAMLFLLLVFLEKEILTWWLCFHFFSRFWT